MRTRKAGIKWQIREIETEGVDGEAQPERGASSVVVGDAAGHDGLDHSYHAVYFNGYEDSSLNVLVVCFANTTDWDLYSTTQQAVLLATLRLVAELGLEVAFPTRTVHVSGMTL